MGWLKDFSRLFFPVTCEVCGRALVEGERVLCLECMAQMPRVGAHLDAEHPFAKRFVAAARVERVASMFVYMRDTSYARVLQKSKYNSRPDIDHDLAMEFAAELAPLHFFDGIDLVLPVPMYAWKKLWRGFNQAEEIAAGVAAVSGVEIGDNLVARRGHATQTRRNAEERLKNAQGIYSVVEPEELEGKHVLIVDDVITTGATLLACCDAVRQAVPDVKISILSLAATRMG